MVKPTPQFNLSLEEAIEVLQGQVEKNQRQTEEGQADSLLDAMTPHEAYDVGYATLLDDLKSLTGPDPLEVYVIPVGVPLPDMPETHIERKDELND